MNYNMQQGLSAKCPLENIDLQLTDEIRLGLGITHTHIPLLDEMQVQLKKDNVRQICNRSRLILEI